MSDVKATLGDAVAEGFCTKGVRRWCDSHGIDFREFAREGISVSRLEDTQDARGLKVATRARERHHVK